MNITNPTTVPKGAVPLKLFCEREAKRTGLLPRSVLQRINAGWYVGQVQFRLSSRHIWVVSPGKCRAQSATAAKVHSWRRSCRPVTGTSGKGKQSAKPAKRLHERARLPLAEQKNFRPSPDKYSNWMAFHGTGGMTPRYHGSGG